MEQQHCDTSGALDENVIKELLHSITDTPNRTGFEAYVIVERDDGQRALTKMSLREDGQNSFRDKVKNAILEVLQKEYLADEASYVSVSRIADEQNKFYIIPTDETYDPFAILGEGSTASFSKDDIAKAKGLAFCLSCGGVRLWAYQHLWSMMLPGKAKKYLSARLTSSGAREYFDEMTEPIMNIAKRVDILIIGHSIVTKDYKLLQNRFGFQTFIIACAQKTIRTIAEKGIIENIDKLNEYIERGNGKTSYAKKMLRISDSRVLNMPLDKLMENIHKSKRWNGKIQEQNGKFVLSTYVQVELMIDLLDERYTVSEITGEEYDTSVKIIAAE